jgi:transcription elongation factor Elf1
MPAKAKKQTPEKAMEKEIVFVCKFCGKTKPLSDMVVLRRFYPQITTCKECAKDTKSSE